MGAHALRELQRLRLRLRLLLRPLPRLWGGHERLAGLLGSLEPGRAGVEVASLLDLDSPRDGPVGLDLRVGEVGEPVRAHALRIRELLLVGAPRSL